MCYGFNAGFGGFGGIGMILGMVLHLAFAALVIFGFIWLIKKGTTGGFSISNNIGALETLNVRYAKGELSSEDYKRMKKELE